jgi:hypothetical protein
LPGLDVRSLENCHDHDNETRHSIKNSEYALTIKAFDIIHLPLFDLEWDVSETGFFLRRQVKLTQLGPIEGCIRTGHIRTISRIVTLILTYHHHQHISEISEYHLIGKRPTARSQYIPWTPTYLAFFTAKKRRNLH